MLRFKAIYRNLIGMIGIYLVVSISYAMKRYVAHPENLNITSMKSRRKLCK